MKKCSTCHQEKELFAFTKDARNRDGLSYECRECKNKRQRKGPNIAKNRGHAIAFSKRQNQIAKYGLAVIETMDTLSASEYEY